MRTVAFTVFFVLLSWRAGAAEPDEGQPGGLDHAVPTVVRAFEIAVAGGYVQGTGEIGDDMNHVQDLSGPGGGGELKLAYRPNASLAFGGFGGCSPLGSPDVMMTDATSTTATAGVFADWHFRADRSLDPWVGLAAGWRGFWIVPDEGETETASMHGLEVARLQIGLDYRITPEIAIAPLIGASVALFLTQEVPGMSGYEDINGPRPSFFFFGGLQARFDLFGARAPTSGALAARR